MKTSWYKTMNYASYTLLLFGAMACTPSGGDKSNKTNNKMTDFKVGSYGYDVAFFAENKINTIELKGADSRGRVLLIPAFQGRIMTSTANGNEGASFGWINYKLIKSGKVSKQFNPYGGEERLWLGPEGGNFSVYFKQGKEQVFENWVVPKEIDTETYDIVSQDSGSVKFKKNFELKNYSGTLLNIGIERTVKLLTRNEIENDLNVSFPHSLDYVAYQSENVLINRGNNDWNAQSGLLSIWMLSMFNPSEKGVVFIPFHDGSEKDLGTKVNDDYFGKVPANRLLVKDNILFFKTDGKYRSKIGISPKRALSYCGSYDSDKRVLTLLWYSMPEELMNYVNSKWGNQDDPLKGDAVNSYNDGPVADGSVMGPFYEIESSSPAAKLKAGGKIVHIQRIFHFSGTEEQLNQITENLFKLSISEIKNAFVNN